MKILMGCGKMVTDWRDKFISVFAQTEALDPEEAAGDELKGMLIEFHEYWYLASRASEWYVPAEKAKEWKNVALQLGTEALVTMQNALKLWFSTHNYKDPDSMWRTRVQTYADFVMTHRDVYDDDYTLGSYLQYLIKTGMIREEYYTGYGRAQLKNQYRVFLDQINESNIETVINYLGRDNYHQYLEEMIDPEDTNSGTYDVDQAIEIWKEIETNNGIKEFFDQIPIDAIKDPAIQDIVARALMENHSNAIATWESNKSEDPNATKKEFTEISDLAEAQIERNDAALASKDLNQIASELSLTLNLKHNFGNLILDHMQIGRNFLDELSNMDTSELDEILKQNGFNPNNAWQTDYQKNKDTMDIQHPYYQQKEVERQQRYEMDELPPEYRKPWTGASRDWRDTFVASFKKVRFMSQVDAERLSPSDDTMMISITDPDKPEARLSGWKHLLRLKFDDLCPDELRSIGRTDLIKTAKFFTEEQARSVVHVSNALPPEVRNIVVHCRKGRSRSVAVARYLAEKFNCELNLTGLNPNPHVYALLKMAG
jgi:predicted protein tyrosine phosphatase